MAGENQDKKKLTNLMSGVRKAAILMVAVGEEAGTIEEVYEPFLIQQGFIRRTPRGRMATELAYHHFGYDAKGKDTSLFE